MNLHAVLKYSGMDRHALGAALFPGRSHPYHAVTRILDGKSELTVSQLATLSRITGLTADQLLTLTPSGWSSLPKSAEATGLQLVRGGFGAFLEANRVSITLTHRGKLIAQLYVPGLFGAPLRDVIAVIDEAAEKWIAEHGDGDEAEQE